MSIMNLTMPSDRDERRPQACLEVGLNCRDCTRETARQLARVCIGLRGKAISQLFVQIHSHAACAPMHAHFAASYREAHGQLVPKPMGIADTARAATAAA